MDFSLPWDQSTLFGYSLEICFNIFVSEAYLLVNGALLLQFISICLHHRTFQEIFQNEARKLDHRDKNRNDAEHLRNMICFHIAAKK